MKLLRSGGPFLNMITWSCLLKMVFITIHSIFATFERSGSISPSKWLLKLLPSGLLKPIPVFSPNRMQLSKKPTSKNIMHRYFKAVLNSRPGKIIFLSWLTRFRDFEKMCQNDKKMIKKMVKQFIWLLFLKETPWILIVSFSSNLWLLFWASKMLTFRRKTLWYVWSKPPRKDNSAKNIHISNQVSQLVEAFFLTNL